MRYDSTLTNASHEYAAAYAAHYTQRDLPLAVQLYQKILAEHAGEREADYARMQLQNIVKAVVPQQELLAAELQLLLLHSGDAGPAVRGRPSVTAGAAAQGRYEVLKDLPVA